MSIALNHSGRFSESTLLSFVSYIVLSLCGCGPARFSAAAPAAYFSTVQGFTITRGGTYTGVFSSNDPKIPAITIQTSDPVIIQNAIVSGLGDLVRILDAKNGVGSNVTITSVTGIALDPGIAGSFRGAFVSDEHADLLSVTNCTMTGVSFGVYIVDSTLSSLTISKNLAYNMEDRPSDGAGGLIPSRGLKGHWVQLNKVVASNGADISWNQVINTPGQASTEDIIDMYDSQATSAINPIRIHDNYLQGAFSAGTSAYEYSGGGIMSEGASPLFAKTSAFIEVDQNEIVMSSNYGIAITAGHDITMSENRVVSCGIDTSGNWYAGQSGVAQFLWNISTSPVFFNNHITGTSGGLVRPDQNGHAMVSDSWSPEVSAVRNNTTGPSAFDNPCWTGKSVISNQAEIAELARWHGKTAAAMQVLGDNHLQP